MFAVKIFVVLMVVVLASALPANHPLQNQEKRLVNIGCDSTDFNLVSLTVAGLYVVVPGQLNLCGLCMVTTLNPLVKTVVDVLKSLNLPIVDSLLQICPVQKLLTIDSSGKLGAITSLCEGKLLYELLDCTADLLPQLVSTLSGLTDNLAELDTLVNGLLSGLTGLTGGMAGNSTGGGLLSGLTNSLPLLGK